MEKILEHWKTILEKRYRVSKRDTLNLKKKIIIVELQKNII